MEPTLDELRIEARYWRDKHALYKAKAYALRPTRPGRLRELERSMQGAEARLRRAEARRRGPGHAAGPPGD